MARTGRSLSELAAEIESRSAKKADLIAPVAKLSIDVIDDQPKLVVQNGSPKAYDINEIAHAQIAEFAGIPLPYYKRMLESDPTLLRDNINRWFEDRAAAGEGRIVRTIGGTARALLSNKFRVNLENEDLLEAALPTLKELGVVVASCEVTDKRMYVKVVDKSVTFDLPSGAKLGEGHVRIRTMSPALSFGNSEVGMGSFFVKYGIWDGFCTNLASFESAFRQIHSGTKHALTDDAYELLSDETRNATDHATVLQVRDIIKGAFDRAKFDAQMRKMQGAVEDRMPVKEAVEVVTRAARKFSFSKFEQEGILGELMEGMDYTRFGLQAAVTSFSQNEKVGYDRATDLEAIGGDIIDLSPTQWRELVPA